MQRKERLRAHCRRFFFAIETNNSQHTDGNSQLFIYGHALTFLDDYFHDCQSLKRVTGTFILIFSSFISFINFQRWILTSKRLRRFINLASLLGPVEVFVLKSRLLINTLNCFSQIYWSEWVIAFKFSLFDKGQVEHMIWKVVSKPARAGPAWYRTHRAGIFAWISWFCLSYHSHVPIRFIIDIVCFECTWPKTPAKPWAFVGSKCHQNETDFIPFLLRFSNRWTWTASRPITYTCKQKKTWPYCWIIIELSLPDKTKTENWKLTRLAYC